MNKQELKLLICVKNREDDPVHKNKNIIKKLSLKLSIMKKFRL